jgi:hypothetical protein
MCDARFILRYKQLTKGEGVPVDHHMHGDGE